jgi:hypothetical protein
MKTNHPRPGKDAGGSKCFSVNGSDRKYIRLAALVKDRDAFAFLTAQPTLAGPP